MMRSLLFVPGDSERKLAKARESGADALIIDLEDSVAPDSKSKAREIAAEFLRSASSGTLLYVRVNELGSPTLDDELKAIVPLRPAGLMLPKCCGFADLEHMATKLRAAEAEAAIPDGAIGLLPLITETARSVLVASAFRASPRLSGVTWGAEDLSASIGASASRDAAGVYTGVFQLARALTLLAAAASDTAAIDTVYPDFRDEVGFRADCLAAERDGFVGKLAIHPAQVPVINEIFTPTAEAVQKAGAVVAAFASAGNAGVVSIDGKMFDRPHQRLAERLLARARSTPER